MMDVRIAPKTALKFRVFSPKFRANQNFRKQHPRKSLGPGPSPPAGVHSGGTGVASVDRLPIAMAMRSGRMRGATFSNLQAASTCSTMNRGW